MATRTVLVTGGARGIGKGMAKSFLEAGHRVMIADLPAGGDWRYPLGSDTEMTSTVDELSAIGEVRCTPVDVTDTASCEQAVRSTVDTFGGERLLHLLLADRFLARLQGSFQLVLECIPGAAGLGAFLTRQLVQPAQEAGYGAVAPQIVPVPCLRRFERPGRSQLLLGTASQFVKRLHFFS